MSNQEDKSQEIVKRTRKLYYRIDEKYLVFGIFFLISSILWFLIALSKEYTTVIDVPVKYINIPKDKALINKPVTSLRVEVHAHGFSLLKYYLNLNVKVANVDVERMMQTDNTDVNNPRYFVSTKYSQKRLLKNLSAEYAVHDIMPDSLVFQFSKIVSKKVKVKPNFSLQFQKQHKLKGELVSIPDCVTVFGPFLIIDTLKEVYTKHLEVENLSTATSKNVAVKEYPNLRISPTRVTVAINVEKFTEQIVSVPISLINLPKDYTVTLNQEQVDIRFVVGISEFGMVREKDFIVEVDCEHISDMPDRLQVKLKSFPSNIQMVGFVPKSVEYVLVKK